MKLTHFFSQDEIVFAEIFDPVKLQSIHEFDGVHLDGVSSWAYPVGGGLREVQFVEILAGGQFGMHASNQLAFCHIVSGEGNLELPDGRLLRFSGPETYVFEPGARHAWKDVVSTTLLAVILIPKGEKK